jgi:hypothetical protein
MIEIALAFTAGLFDSAGTVHPARASGSVPPNRFALSGILSLARERATSPADGGEILLRFNAPNFDAVAGITSLQTMSITVDGAPQPRSPSMAAGSPRSTADAAASMCCTCKRLTRSFRLSAIVRDTTRAPVRFGHNGDASDCG